MKRDEKDNQNEKNEGDMRDMPEETLTVIARHRSCPPGHWRSVALWPVVRSRRAADMSDMSALGRGGEPGTTREAAEGQGVAGDGRQSHARLSIAYMALSPLGRHSDSDRGAPQTPNGRGGLR